MDTLAQRLKRQIDDTARDLDLSPQTVARLIGKGGKWYVRLEGARMFAETYADAVLSLEELRAARSKGRAQESAAALPA